MVNSSGSAFFVLVKSECRQASSSPGRFLLQSYTVVIAEAHGLIVLLKHAVTMLPGRQHEHLIRL